ncbi:MAG TPA: hypothetical protein PK668_17210 [Myxococcota bacterium]|nr:hypothetical protein [Myxococcota bacterium]HRY94899.1 hypothetical protein [Myxococcota bacterium]
MSRRLRALSGRLVKGVKRLNARLVPPETFMGTLTLGLSAVEEAYFVTKNFIDGSIHVSERVLYEHDYHERRLRDYAGQRRLVLFVPGYMQSPVCFYRLERYLGLEMFDTFTYTWGDFAYSQDLTLTAQQLEDVLRDLVGRTRVSQIFLVGHSQGGIAIRTMVQHGQGRDLPIKKCLFLSSPHQGTWAALAALPHWPLRSVAGLLPYVRKVQGESGIQLMPGSDFLKVLNGRPLPEGIRFSSIYYALDPMIWPPENAILPYPEAENHFIPKIGHAQPLYCSRAARIAMRSLFGDAVCACLEDERDEVGSAGAGI